MVGEKDRQEIVALKASIDSKLFQSYCHSLVGGNIVKHSERDVSFNYCLNVRKAKWIQSPLTFQMARSF